MDYALCTMHSRLKPVVYQAARNGCLVGDFGQAVATKPASAAQLLALQADLAALVVGRKAYHESAGEWPRLACKVPDVANGDAGLLHHLAPYALFERLARLHESGHEAVEVATEALGVDEQYLVAPRDAHYDGHGKRGPPLLAAARALLADGCLPAVGRAADAAVARGGVEIDEFGSLARKAVVLGAQ